MGICNSKVDSTEQLKIDNNKFNSKNIINNPEIDFEEIDLETDDDSSDNSEVLDISDNEKELNTNIFTNLENEVKKKKEEIDNKRTNILINLNKNYKSENLDNFLNKNTTKKENEYIIKILYLEDEEFHFRLIEYLLNKRLKFKYKLICTSDGLEGYNMIFDHNPDIILLDINLPSLKGDDILIKLHKQNFDMSKIAVISKLAKNSDLIKIIDLGVVDYLIKPIDILNFINMIEQRINVQQLLNAKYKS